MQVPANDASSPTSMRTWRVPNGALLPATTTPDARKRLAWTGSFFTFMTANALKQLRVRLLRKLDVPVELTRQPMPKYGIMSDPAAARYRGKGGLCLVSMLFPGEMAISGTYQCRLSLKKKNLNVI
jgi:hypothetical protein